MQRGELLKEATERLREQEIEDPRPNAERLLADALGIDRPSLYLNPQTMVPEQKRIHFEAMLRRLEQGEPIDYILGLARFYDLTLAVRPGVLIPRPETELLVDRALEAAPENGFPLALDVGCGSGALLLALLHSGAVRSGVGVDISGSAVDVTVENAITQGFSQLQVLPPNGRGEGGGHLLERHRMRSGEKKAHRELLWVMHADALSKGFTPPGTPFPLVVSNPPYVSASEYEALPVHIREHEPKEALFSGEDGLDAHRALARALPRWLMPGGLFLGEIGAGQGPTAQELHESWAERVTIHPDYAGHDRVVEAYLKQV